MSTSLNSVDEEPPPSIISCRVCGAMIDITNKKNDHVVKCEFCNEATAIKEAPPGQKYIRCPCNCLLICKLTAEKISCPRATCNKIIVLSPYRTKNIHVTPVPGMCLVNCGHCRETFLFNTLVNQLARCPHCERKSSVGRDYARGRGLVFLALALISLILAIVTTVVVSSAVSDSSKGWIAAYVILFLLAIYFGLRSISFYRLKRSDIVGNQS